MIYAEVQAACPAHQDAAQQRGNDPWMSSRQQGIFIRDYIELQSWTLYSL